MQSSLLLPAPLLSHFLLLVGVQNVRSNAFDLQELYQASSHKQRLRLCEGLAAQARPGLQCSLYLACLADRAG